MPFSSKNILSNVALYFSSLRAIKYEQVRQLSQQNDCIINNLVQIEIHKNKIYQFPKLNTDCLKYSQTKSLVIILLTIKVKRNFTTKRTFIPIKISLISIPGIIQTIIYQQGMKPTYIFTLVITLLVTIKADYFAGVLPDQKLAIDTTNAINSLKAILIANFDCSDNRRSQQQFGGILNLGVLNLFGQPRKLFPLLQTFFKKNQDKSIINFKYPVNKLSFDSLYGIRKKNELYHKCVAVAQFLSKIKVIFKDFDNVIIGSQNKVNGNKNFVAGSRDNINGNNNWVFTSDLTLNSVQDGVLIIGNYVIELVDIHMIPKNPNEAVRCITTEDSNRRFKKWWGEALFKRKIWL